jgi:hypothetical protein
MFIYKERRGEGRDADGAKSENRHRKARRLIGRRLALFDVSAVLLTHQ